jgi:hypothetical protein
MPCPNHISTVRVSMLKTSKTWHFVACRPGGDATQELQDRVIELEEKLSTSQVDQERCVLTW